MNDSELKTFLEKYELHEQALLLLTRRELGENEKNYIKDILLNPKLDWEKFVGAAIWHRVNGVI
ncbi:hypothetical protein [Kaistella sp.]|uniref:hypothetical protein n=1 Tax=Kaistella sp. TaxID=2782235 RepID=UPI00359F2C45